MSRWRPGGWQSRSPLVRVEPKRGPGDEGKLETGSSLAFHSTGRGKRMARENGEGGETINQKERLDRLIRRQKAEGKTLLKCLLDVTILTPEHLEQVELYLVTP